MPWAPWAEMAAWPLKRPCGTKARSPAVTQPSRSRHACTTCTLPDLDVRGLACVALEASKEAQRAERESRRLKASGRVSLKEIADSPPIPLTRLTRLTRLTLSLFLCSFAACPETERRRPARCWCVGSRWGMARRDLSMRKLCSFRRAVHRRRLRLLSEVPWRCSPGEVSLRARALQAW